MDAKHVSALAIIAGKGAYPRLLAESARTQGVQRLVAIAFRGETDSVLRRHVDELHWLHVGQLTRLLETIQQSGAKQAVMAGQITPTNLFRVRMDRAMITLLRTLKQRNAETIFGAVADALRTVGVELLAASAFMEAHMPAAGVLTTRQPTSTEEADIALGLRVARITSGLEIGQTVVIKEGTILAVEAFEGTDATLKRAGRLGGPGMVVVKVAKPGHDMRFDIPVVGTHTLRLLKKYKAAALAVEAGRAILLERDQLIAAANAAGITLVSAPPPSETSVHVT
ncbi:MAG: UDP-2,3-diacylglucosamine diphosphatase LpxI [Verrucomicrobia bacterium]|nr:UDP-2,3-diacylglucosamine diphosphatase LpxI [Verrucomicrobiota bacterium]